MADLPVRYNIATDEVVPVTQEWVERLQQFGSSLGKARDKAREVVSNGYAPLDVCLILQAFLDAWSPEFQAKDVLDAKQIARAEEDHGSDRARMEATEGLQGGQDSSQRGEGVRKRGSSKSEAPEAREVAAAYAVTVDGWIEIPHKAIRNPNSQHIVWMALPTWNVLASHATDRGLFYIPCGPGCQTVDELRRMVASKETSDAS